MSLTSESILQFLELLNTKLPKLKTLLFKYEENWSNIYYNSNQGRFNLPPSDFRGILDYMDTLTTYDGRVNFTFDYKVNFGIVSVVKAAVEHYARQIETELHGFQYSKQVEDVCYYSFENSNTVSENLQLNVCIQLIH